MKDTAKVKKASWEDIQKEIKWKLDNGKIIDAFVLADPKKGISIGPMNPNEVPKDLSWNIPPSDPNFFFVCTEEREGNESFDEWVNILSQDKEFFCKGDLGLSIFSRNGSCPFSS